MYIYTYAMLGIAQWDKQSRISILGEQCLHAFEGASEDIKGVESMPDPPRS
eukprot:COSAG01_NODE_22061_length_873_cov_1.644703_1_plen_50_part_10